MQNREGDLGDKSGKLSTDATVAELPSTFCPMGTVREM